MQQYKPFSLIYEQESSLPEKIANHILKKIFLGELKQGVRLIEAEVVKELNVSNIPVREAFYILQSTGIVERLPRKGVRIKPATQQEINDYQIALIELFKLGLDYSEGKWDEEKFNQLNTMLLEANEILEKKDFVEYVLKSYQICQYIFIVAENKAFLRFYNEITYITNAYCQTRWENVERIQNCHCYLEAMVIALIDSNFDRAKLEYELLAKESFLNI